MFSWIATLGSTCVAGDVNEFGCQTLPLNYTISVPGCQPKSIKDLYCYGQCQSYFILSGGFSSLRASTCSVCRPSAVKKITLYLKCLTTKRQSHKPRRAIYVMDCMRKYAFMQFYDM